MIIFIIVGMPAAGKNIAREYAEKYNIPYFATGDIVREEVKKQGLRLRLKDKDYCVPDPVVVSTVEEALRQGPFDVAIFAIKSYDTQAALEGLKPYAVALPPFLCLQNGVENEQRLAQVLGEDKVIAGSVTSAIGRRGAGDIILERLRGIGIASAHTLTPTLVAVMQAAGLKARQYDSAPSMKWSKMLTNLLANASSAVLDMSPDAIFANPGLYWLEVQEYREALRVMAAQHIKVTDLPGTPVCLLSWLIEDFPPAYSRPLLVRSLGKGRGGKMPSFHIDLSSGRGGSEVDFLNGAVRATASAWASPPP